MCRKVSLRLLDDTLIEFITGEYCRRLLCRPFLYTTKNAFSADYSLSIPFYAYLVHLYISLLYIYCSYISLFTKIFPGRCCSVYIHHSGLNRIRPNLKKWFVSKLLCCQKPNAESVFPSFFKFYFSYCAIPLYKINTIAIFTL